MNLTKNQVAELKKMLWLHNLNELGEDEFAQRLLAHAPALIETAEWAASTVEMIMNNRLIVDQRKKRRDR